MQSELMEAVNVWSGAFARLDAAAGRDPAWMHRLRADAFARFRELGFPTPQDEEWRYTDVAPIARTAFRPAPATSTGAAAALTQLAFPESAAGTIVFVNGRFSRELSPVRALPDGVIAGSLALAMRELSSQVEPHLARHAAYGRHAFAALNTALLEDGAFVYLPRGRALDIPIHIVHLTVPGPDAVVTHPRTLIVADRGAEATVVETYAGTAEGTWLTNAVTELVASENASVRHWRIQRESDQAFHTGTLQVALARHARVHSLNFAFGGALARTDINAVLGAEGAEVHLNGLYLATGDQLVDNHTLIDHARPHCASREIYKGILAGRARGVFNGKVYVRPDAQKTDGKQTNKNLLLSKEALVNTKPQLEIFANDVKCTHGATIGQLEEEQVFYLRARGIAERDARSLLTHAFAGEILEQVTIASLRERLDAAIFARLPEL